MGDKEKCWECKFSLGFLKIHLECYNCIHRSDRGAEENFQQKEEEGK